MLRPIRAAQIEHLNREVKMKLLGTLMAVWVLTFSTIALAAEDAKRVYIVASYEQHHVCGWPQEQGVIKGLVQEG